MPAHKPTILIVLDGFGVWREQRGNPLFLASTPHLEEISRSYPGVALNAAGIEVGLPWGEVGNSEVGHYNIGAGMVTYQSLPRIQFAMKDGTFFRLPFWDEMISQTKKHSSVIHLIGLISSGGIHSDIQHLYAILELLAQRKVQQPVFIHAITDGQDVQPGTAKQFIEGLEKKMQLLGIGRIATVTGRHYAMDKSENWDLTEQTYNCMVRGKGRMLHSPLEALTEPDEFVLPSIMIDTRNQPFGNITPGDAVFFFNFRPDRARQLVDLFLKNGPEKLLIGTMTEYRKDLPVSVALPAVAIKNPLAKVISDAGKKQFHIAETEKYAHVTYFLNTGTEKPFPGEDRAIIPSPKVDSYDLKPEMAAYEITERVVAEIAAKKYDFVAINFANADLVAHTGNEEAAVHAMTVLDNCLGKIIPAALGQGGAIVITADHGNIEEMLTLATGTVDTEHSTNPVPCWIIAAEKKMALDNTKTEALPDITANGILADVAPTILELMNLKQPPEMSGQSLYNLNERLILK